MLTKKNMRIKLRPCNIEAEQNLLGLLLINNKNLNKIDSSLKEEHFFLPLHKRIYFAIIKLSKRGLIADPISLKNFFLEEEIFKNSEINSYEYLLKLIEETQLNSELETLIKSIKNTYIRRRIIDLSENYIIKARNEKIEDQEQDLIKEMEKELYILSESFNDNNQCYSLSYLLKNTLKNIKNSFERKEEINGIDTGYKELNNYTGGFQNSDLIIIAGRPSMGKTSLGLNIILNSAKYFMRKDSNKQSVGFFSLEMSSEQIASRILSIETKIDNSKIRVGKLNNREFRNLSNKIFHLNQIPIIIDDNPGLSISMIRSKARKMKRENNIGMLFIDYLQLISSDKRYKENRVQEIAEISRGLKIIAKELNIPVITASQLSRAVELRENKRPILSDLRESGNIEQDADIVIFIYREEYYLSRKIPISDEKEILSWQGRIKKIEGMSEIIISKHRNGPVGSFVLKYDKLSTSFDNLINNV